MPDRRLLPHLELLRDLDEAVRREVRRPPLAPCRRAAAPPRLGDRDPRAAAAAALLRATAAPS